MKDKWLAAVLLLLLMAMPAVAAENSGDGKWDFGAEVYLWGAGINGTTAAGDDIDISFSDLISNLDMALMTTLAAHKDKWTLFADVIYMDVSGDQKGTAHIIGHPIKTKTDVELEAWIVTTAAAYAVMETDTTRLDLLGGARYLWMETNLKFDIGDHISQKFSDSGYVWDGIIGVRGKTRLNEKWYLTYYADVGTGDTDLTWQAVAGVNYRFKKVDVVFGYRYLDWDFDSSAPFDDMNLSGPYGGVKFFF